MPKVRTNTTLTLVNMTYNELCFLLNGAVSAKGEVLETTEWLHPDGVWREYAPLPEGFYLWRTESISYGSRVEDYELLFGIPAEFDTPDVSFSHGNSRCNQDGEMPKGALLWDEHKKEWALFKSTRA